MQVIGGMARPRKTAPPSAVGCWCHYGKQWGSSSSAGESRPKEGQSGLSFASCCFPSIIVVAIEVVVVVEVMAVVVMGIRLVTVVCFSHGISHSLSRVF